MKGWKRNQGTLLNSDRNDGHSPSLGSRGSTADSSKIITEGYDTVVEFN